MVMPLERAMTSIVMIITIATIARSSSPAVRQASVAAPQLGAAVGILCVVRCAVEQARGPAGGSQFVASGLGGAAAVAVMNTALPSRREWHVKYYTAALGSKAPVGVGVVAAASALSGAIVLGGADTLLQKGLGLRLG